MVVLFLAATLALGTQTGVVRPHLSVPDTAPFTVRGTGFRIGERVSIVVNARNRASRTVTAGVAGGFLARMPAVELGSCPAYAVQARGSRGSRASLKVVPECAALQPVDR